MRLLYHTPLSPACRKIRLMLAEKGLPFHLTAIHPWDIPQDYYQLNPSGEVPMMIEESGEHILGNYALSEYLEEKYPSPNLMGKTLTERNLVRAQIDWFDGKFEREVSQPLLQEKIYKRMARSGAPDTHALREAKRAVEYHLDYICFCTEEKPWLAGDLMTLADLTAGAHLSAMDYLGDVPWSKFPEAQQWYAILKSRPSFRAILAERLPGILPPPHYENPDFE
jgi:glutathione S-transferase